jgi:hypothetical protein
MASFDAKPGSESAAKTQPNLKKIPGIFGIGTCCEARKIGHFQHRKSLSQISNLTVYAVEAAILLTWRDLQAYHIRIMSA